jgi:alanine racemase
MQLQAVNNRSTQVALSTWTDLSPREAALAEGLRVWAEIDLDKLEANVRALKQRAGEARLLVVVKANGYGHGAVSVALAASHAGAWGFGVASLEEGDELRRAGVTSPIIVLSGTRPAQAMGLVERNLSVTVGYLEMGEALSEAAQALGRPAKVHVKVETGMNRFGAALDEAVALAERLRELPGIEVEGVASHLATADDADPAFTREQDAAYRACLERLPWVPIQHISNTAGLLNFPEMRYGLVRCGLGVYGYYPSPDTAQEVPLQPVLSLRSRVAKVAELKVGESVGYSRTWRASRPSRVAVVLTGYGDGIQLALSNKGVGLVRGQRAPYAGRVMMDMLTLDVTDIPGVAVDDEVTLIGTQDGETVDVDEMAARAGTISYEVLTGLMERVPRLYLREGRLIARQDLTGLRRTLST